MGLHNEFCKPEVLKPLKCIIDAITNNSNAVMKKYGEFEKYTHKEHNHI